MPNWCTNIVEIAHKDPAKLKEVVEAYNEGKFCNFAKPVPKELQIVAGRVGSNEEYAQQLLEFTEQLNMKFFGYKHWYDFCVNEWGTKWDVGGDGDKVELEEDQTDTTFDFCSAWSPPIGAYEALLEQGFEVRAYYYEPGMAYAGIWDNGDDNYYEIGGETSETIKEAIPEELDEMFVISETMAEYEDMEANEEYNHSLDDANAKDH